MPLFVPILRLVMLFLNIYESYKTLRKPKPSPRHSGQPSVRALSQRKRDMKGCLAVWLVWVHVSTVLCIFLEPNICSIQCTLATYERMVEGIVSLFIPFYDEFKSMALLFLILTRARVRFIVIYNEHILKVLQGCGAYISAHNPTSLETIHFHTRPYF